MVIRKEKEFLLRDGIKYGSIAPLRATGDGRIRLEQFDLYGSAEAEEPESSYLQIHVGSGKFHKHISLPYKKEVVNALAELLRSINYPVAATDSTMNVPADETKVWKDLSMLDGLTFGVEEPKVKGLLLETGNKRD